MVPDGYLSDDEGVCLDEGGRSNICKLTKEQLIRKVGVHYVSFWRNLYLQDEEFKFTDAEQVTYMVTTIKKSQKVVPPRKLQVSVHDLCVT